MGRCAAAILNGVYRRVQRSSGRPRRGGPRRPSAIARADEWLRTLMPPIPVVAKVRSGGREKPNFSDLAQRTPAPVRLPRDRSSHHQPFSTKGTKCGGFNGWPMTQRSGCQQSVCTRLINSPDELDVMTIFGSRDGVEPSQQRALQLLALGSALLDELGVPPRCRGADRIAPSA